MSEHLFIKTIKIEGKKYTDADRKKAYSMLFQSTAIALILTVALVFIQ